jgi:hypothetical protein
VSGLPPHRDAATTRKGRAAGARSGRLPHRLETDAEEVQRDLVRLVLTIVELVRQLMERQALRRVDAGDLSDDQVEQLGLALMRLEEAMTELQRRFDIDARDLNLDLGPLGPLLPPD